MSLSDIKISVIIPTWNRADCISNAINSVLAQTFPVFEILICDDGSNDNTKEIIDTFPNEIVKWLSGPRGGCPAIPRNRGIKAAKGNWIAFLDSDDEWLPKKLEKQVEKITATGAMASCTNATRLVPSLGLVGCVVSHQKSEILLNDLLDDNRIICSSVLINRNLLKKIGFFPETHNLKVGEDYSLWLRSTSIANFQYLDQPLLIYNDDPTDSARAFSPGYWFQKRQVFGNYFNWYWNFNKFHLPVIIVKFILINLYSISLKIYNKSIASLALFKKKVLQK
jgi:glycosyltransferase involved in cell wall biosynthesis